MTGAGVIEALRDALGLRRGRGAAAVRAPATLVAYDVELRVGVSTRRVVAVSSEPAEVVCACVRRAHGADVAYASVGGELVALAARGSGVR